MLILTFAAALAAAPAAALDYQLDPSASRVAFRIREFGGTAEGRFQKFEGGFSYEPGKPETWKARARIDAASIDTGKPKRDAHLRRPDFFDVERCPDITFQGAKASEVRDGKAKLQGELTMHCVTRPVTLDLEIGAVAKDSSGTHRAAFSARTTVDRKDFGIVWNKALDNGGVLLGDSVDVSIEAVGIGRPGSGPAARSSGGGADAPVTGGVDSDRPIR